MLGKSGSVDMDKWNRWGNGIVWLFAMTGRIGELRSLLGDHIARHLDLNSLTDRATMEIFLRARVPQTRFYDDEPHLTPLVAACMHDHVGCAALLIHRNADIDVRLSYTSRYLELGRDKWTALDIAVMNESENCLKLLIARGADVNAVDRIGASALLTACEHGSPRSVELLLEKGADPFLEDAYGWNPLIAACRYNHVSCAQLLLAQYKVADPVRAKAATNACEFGTALRECCIKGYSECLSVMCELMSDVNDLNVTNGILLHLACDGDHINCVRVLCAAGVHVNHTLNHLLAAEAEDNQFMPSSTPLHVAAVGGHIPIIDVLHHYGADLEGVPLDEPVILLPVVLAFLAGKAACAAHLIDIGAQVPPLILLDISLAIASITGNSDMITVLIRHGVQASNSPMDSPMRDTCSMAFEALQLNDQTSKAMYPLELAIVHGHAKCVELLFANGPDVHQKWADGSLPVEKAREYGRSECVRILESEMKRLEDKQIECRRRARIAEERRQRQDAETSPLTIPGPSHRDAPKVAQAEPSMEQRVKQQRWIEEKVLRSEAFDVRQREVQRAAAARKDAEKLRLQKAAIAEAEKEAEAKTHSVPSPVSISDHLSASLQGDFGGIVRSPTRRKSWKQISF